MVFFFVFFTAASDLAVDVEEIEEEPCKEKERGREVEREPINFFGFRNKYGMY